MLSSISFNVYFPSFNPKISISPNSISSPSSFNIVPDDVSIVASFSLVTVPVNIPVSSLMIYFVIRFQ